ncbi:MAG TPA: cellulose synthase subunit BcsC-related outer membrane protein [Steroidobacteraceae bacterium]
MGLMVALVATLALALPADGPRDAAGWRAQSDAFYAQGDFRSALDAAEKARLLDPADPWARYAWVRALAAVDPESARKAMPGLQDPVALKNLPDEERARLKTALGYLCLDLGIEPLAAMFFGEVPPATPSHPQAQAGLAILAVRRGNSRQALVHFVAARSTVRLDPSLAELERDARYQVVLHEFVTARDLRDANAAGRAYSVLDELRPSHPATLRARADLANLRGDSPARERALRDLLAVDRQAPGAASELVDTLLDQNRPYDAFVVARDMAPERLAIDTGLQAIERDWVTHLEAAIGGRWRSGQVDHDHLDDPQLQIAWAGSHPRWGRIRLSADALYPESDRVPAGEPFGSLVALPAISESQSDKGIAGLVQWAPRNGVVLEFGTTPTSFEVNNLIGALRFRVESAAGPWSFGFDRSMVRDSLLSLAGTVDPLSGQTWGGVIRDRAYFGGRFGDEALHVYGALSGAVFDGHRVDSNTQWRADAGFLRRAGSGEGWTARVGGIVELAGFATNRSHFTLGHGGYFSPEKFVSVGPVIELLGRNEVKSFRFEGGLAWQAVRESGSDFFPTDPALQAANGDLRYAGDSREGLAARIAASVEWRVSDRAVAGVRLEGVRGEDANEVRLQLYTRRWHGAISEPVREPPAAMLAPETYFLN